MDPVDEHGQVRPEPGVAIRNRALDVEARFRSQVRHRFALRNRCAVRRSADHAVEVRCPQIRVRHFETGSRQAKRAQVRHVRSAEATAHKAGQCPVVVRRDDRCGPEADTVERNRVVRPERHATHDGRVSGLRFVVCPAVSDGTHQADLVGRIEGAVDVGAALHERRMARHARAADRLDARHRIDVERVRRVLLELHIAAHREREAVGCLTHHVQRNAVRRGAFRFVANRGRGRTLAALVHALR